MTQAKRRRSQKSGLPPGALVHIGEVKTGTPTLTSIEIGPEGVVERALVDAAALDSLATHPSPLRWLNVYGVHDDALMHAIGRRFDLHPLVLEDILNTEQRPKVEIYDDYLFIVGRIYDTSRGNSDLASDQICLILGRDFVLSFQERRSGTFEPIRQRLRSERNPLHRQGADHLAHALLDAMVDSYFNVIEHMSDRCDALEEEILGKAHRDVLHKTHALKRELSRLRQAIWPMREMLGNLHRNPSPFFSDETRLYLRDIHDHAIHLLEQLEDLRELLTGLLDVYLNSVSNRLNQEVHTLTLLTTVFMPATLVTGIFGMNFQKMPWLESPDGFSLALMLMAGVAFALFAALRLHRLLR